MQNIPIQAIPNQRFTVVVDDNQWEIAIKTTNGVVSVSLSLNSVELVSNMRAVANTKIIPAEYEEIGGNFAFVSQSQDLPEYAQFGSTQSLVYISAAELAVLVPNITPSRITVDYFDPIAPLPLRFDPQGYVLAT